MKRGSVVLRLRKKIRLKVCKVLKGYFYLQVKFHPVGLEYGRILSVLRVNTDTPNVDENIRLRSLMVRSRGGI